MFETKNLYPSESACLTYHEQSKLDSPAGAKTGRYSGFCNFSYTGILPAQNSPGLPVEPNETCLERSRLCPQGRVCIYRSIIIQIIGQCTQKGEVENRKK